VRIDLAITSGLPRTVQTAEAVLAAQVHLQAAAPTLHTWPEWEEARGGRLRDIPPADLDAAFTALQRGPLTEDTRFLGGERLGDLLDRVLPAWDRLRALPGWDTALVVAHGVVNAALLSHVVSGGQRLVLPGWQQNPACVNLIDLGDAPGNDLLRAANLNPTDGLQRDARASTMERLRDDFAQWQAAARSAHRVTP
jgi:probable phosphoglycerate mutase